MGSSVARCQERAAILLILGVSLAWGLGCGPTPDPLPGLAPASAPAPALAPEGEIAALATGSSDGAPLAGGESHVYRFRLDVGEYFELAVEQLGVDAVATVFDPDGQQLFRVDSPNGDRGPEPVLFVARVAGDHRLEVTAGSRSRPGCYILQAVAERPATEEDRQRAATAELFRRGETLRRSRSAEAIDVFRDALARWRDLGEDAFWVSETWDRLGRVHGSLGQWREAMEAHQRAEELFRARGEWLRQAATWDQLGKAFRELGDQERAIACFERSLSLWHEAGHGWGEAAVWNNLGVTYQELGELQRALEVYTLAMERWRELGFRRGEALALHNLASLHAYLRRDPRALDLFESARDILAEIGADRELAATLDQIGQLQVRSGALEEALAQLEWALELRIKTGDRLGKAYTLANLSLVKMETGELERASELYNQALPIFDERNELLGKAQTLLNLGRIEAARDRHEKARARFSEALEIFRRIDALPGQADALACLASTERRLGQLDAARKYLEEGLGLYEQLRRLVHGQDLRTAYFTSLVEQYGAYVDLLAELHERQPWAGHDVRAFEASERSRARSLLELLENARDRPRRDAAPELLARELSIQEELSAAEKLRLGYFDRPLDEERRDTLDRRRRVLVEELNAVRARIHADGPRRPWVEPAARDLAEIRQRVLDPDTLLLEVDLGKERGFLWVVSTDRLESYVLPPEEEVTAAALTAHRLLTVSHRRESAAGSRAALCRLSRMVLGPVFSATETASKRLVVGKRLVVVTEGALQYIPFAALPHPAHCGGSAGGNADPLVVDHEIVHLPSASVLAALNEGRADRASAEHPGAPASIAVFADPIFGPDSRFRRLPHSLREAEAILALAPSRTPLLASGFAARKTRVMDGRLADYRFIHFATHGVLDPEHPELSSLALTEVDEAGGAVDGTLHAHEICNLELAAELVVLSACRTALGTDIRGEGLVGLTQSFLQAGAARVLVSLWDVDDRVTAELMEAFYRQLFEAGLSPAAALRQAQLTLRHQEGRRAPYYWAGFVLQGEWRSPI